MGPEFSEQGQDVGNEARNVGRGGVSPGPPQRGRRDLILATI